MKRTILFYGLALGALIFALKYLQYRFLIRDLPYEVYIGLIAVGFTILGVWSGIKIAKRRKTEINQPITDVTLPVGLSKREMEVLYLMAQGLSNQEIADKLFLSLNTVKTHVGNLYIKLDVKRRTQAIQKAKSAGLLV